MNLYFEIPLSHETRECQYIAVFDCPNQWSPINSRPRLREISDRIWGEIDGRVHYVKNRYRNTATPVDMKEFMFIKLRSTKA